MTHTEPEAERKLQTYTVPAKRGRGMAGAKGDIQSRPLMLPK